MPKRPIANWRHLVIICDTHIRIHFWTTLESCQLVREAPWNSRANDRGWKRHRQRRRRERWRREEDVGKQSAALVDVVVYAGLVPINDSVAKASPPLVAVTQLSCLPSTPPLLLVLGIFIVLHTVCAMQACVFVCVQDAKLCRTHTYFVWASASKFVA